MLGIGSPGCHGLMTSRDVQTTPPPGPRFQTHRWPCGHGGLQMGPATGFVVRLNCCAEDELPENAIEDAISDSRAKVFLGEYSFNIALLLHLHAGREKNCKMDLNSN